MSRRDKRKAPRDQPLDFLLFEEGADSPVIMASNVKEVRRTGLKNAVLAFWQIDLASRAIRVGPVGNGTSIRKVITFIMVTIVLYETEASSRNGRNDSEISMHG